MRRAAVPQSACKFAWLLVLVCLAFSAGGCAAISRAKLGISGTSDSERMPGR